jgi:HD-GYP domain-containing protein (c-di-GMP phosphodiesterase class II)
LVRFFPKTFLSISAVGLTPFLLTGTAGVLGLPGGWETAVGSAAITCALAAALSRRLTRPWSELRRVAMEIAGGDHQRQAPIDLGSGLAPIAQTLNYLTLQVHASEQETGRLYENLEKDYLETIVALANSIDSKDSYTRGHSQRVGEIAVSIGRELGLTERELKHLQYGGILHDIGKIGIPESILLKRSSLTSEEMLLMREHSSMGDEIVCAVSLLRPVRPAVRNHHERWDGTGYPDKLKGEAIPIVARVVTAADTFDACTSTRPYQQALPLEKAMEVIEKLSGGQLDPQVVAALRRVVEKTGVRLEGGLTKRAAS